MEELGFDNIMSDFEMAGLFGGSDGEQPAVVKQGDGAVSVENAETKEDNTDTTEVDPNALFGGVGQSESVGGDSKEGGNSNQENEDSSPNTFSSILSALKDDGVLPELTDEEVDEFNKNKDFGAQDFIDVFNKIIDSRVSQRNKRIEDALNGGADIEEVKQFENIIATLNNIDDDAISEESPKGEDLRRHIIAQDYMNKGFSRERIERELKKSFDAGTDIEDAKEALQNNVQFYNSKYQEIVQRGRDADKKFKEDTRKQSEDLRKSIVDSTEGIFGEIGVDKKTRQKIYDNISKPAYKDEAGNWYTEIQKYEMEHKTDFLKYVSLFFTMTDGFKNIDKVVNKTVQKKVGSAVQDLQKKLQNTQRTGTGNLKMVGQGDSESQYLGDNLVLL